MNCYIDTISLFIDDADVDNLTGWKFYKARQRDRVLTDTDRRYRECWKIRVASVSICYYPYIRRLFTTFSIPRVIRGSNLNHVDNLDTYELTSKVYSLLQMIGTLPNDLLCWNPSRVDLFFHHFIEPKNREHYLNAYKCLYIPRYKVNSCQNTHYVMSNLKRYSQASSVVRIYDKTHESQVRRYREIGLEYPETVDKDFEYEKRLDEALPVNIIRFEMQMMRRKVKYEFCGNSNSPFALSGRKPLFQDVLNADWQVYILNEYIHKLNLDKKILDTDTFRKHVIEQGYRADKENKIIEVARHIRNQRTPQNIKGGLVSAGTLRRYIKGLSKKGYSIITTNLCGGLTPIQYRTYSNGTTSLPISYVTASNAAAASNSIT